LKTAVIAGSMLLVWSKLEQRRRRTLASALALLTHEPTGEIVDAGCRDVGQGA